MLSDWVPYILQDLYRAIRDWWRSPPSRGGKGGFIHYPALAPIAALPAPDPYKEYERVHCNCPEYRGSDFWNDPHRWCDRDPVTERIWAAKTQQCERTVRPKVAPKLEREVTVQFMSDLAALNRQHAHQCGLPLDTQFWQQQQGLQSGLYGGSQSQQQQQLPNLWLPFL